MKKKNEKIDVSLSALIALVVLHVAELILSSIGFGYLMKINYGRSILEGAIVWLVLCLLILISGFCILVINETREG